MSVFTWTSASVGGGGRTTPASSSLVRASFGSTPVSSDSILVLLLLVSFPPPPSSFRSIIASLLFGSNILLLASASAVGELELEFNFELNRFVRLFFIAKRPKSICITSIYLVCLTAKNKNRGGLDTRELKRKRV